VVAVIISFILYSEPLTSSKITGFLLILFSLVLVSIDGTRKIYWRGVFLAILGNCLLGIGWALDKKGMFYFNLPGYNHNVFTTIATRCISKKSKKAY
jgi:drug/metabolite transporter (DMT)-like permease